MMAFMQWELAHRPRDADQATAVTIEAPASWTAGKQLREQIPVEDVVLYIRAAR